MSYMGRQRRRREQDAKGVSPRKPPGGMAGLVLVTLFALGLFVMLDSWWDNTLVAAVVSWVAWFVILNLR